MNTVGKPGKLGEHVRCVVSVSMLTEGWDANTVTHVLGVRAFGTQLLCEQVVGRGLRRVSYVARRRRPVRARVRRGLRRAVLASSPPSGSEPDPKPGPMPTRVRALEDRIACEITFPRLVGYRYEISDEQLERRRSSTNPRWRSRPTDVPTQTEVAAVVGETEVHTPRRPRGHAAPQEVAFLLAKRRSTATSAPTTTAGAERPWLFPQPDRDHRSAGSPSASCSRTTPSRSSCCHDQRGRRGRRADLRSIVRFQGGERRLCRSSAPTTRSARPATSTSTPPARSTSTEPDKCHITHVVADTGGSRSWPATLETWPRSARYVKNQSLGFTIPYTIDGEQRDYVPDFIARARRRPRPTTCST